MSCLNITPLVLSDTFNTWFERTNQCIEGLDSIKMRGLSATNLSGNDVSGFLLEEGDGCFYSISLKTGPFIGFIGASDGGHSSSIHGLGTYENPYNLTLKFTGTELELERSQVVTSDYVLVSDTDDNEMFKKVPASAFLTRLQQGDNIKIVDNGDGSFTISYNETFYDINFNLSSSPFTFSPQEVGTPNTGVVQFSVQRANNSTIGLTSGRITTDPSKVSGFSENNLTINDLGSSGSLTNDITINSQNWYTVNNTTVTFTASVTSDNKDLEGNPVQQLSISKNISKTYGLQFVAFSGDYGTTGEIENDFANYRNGLSGATGNLRTSPRSRVAYTWSFIDDEPRYYYFAHTEKSTNPASSFGYDPKFYPDNGSIVESNFSSIGYISYNNKTYEIFRSPNKYPSGGVFGIEG